MSSGEDSDSSEGGAVSHERVDFDYPGNGTSR